MPEAPFDSVAQGYDDQFTDSIIGRLQRNRVHFLTSETLASKGKLKILEINCGTGTDAIWLSALGHDIIATDLSAEMIKVAQSKAPSLNFEMCGLMDLSKRYDGVKFDIIFSNFAGLNCLSELELKRLQSELSALLNEKGKLIAVLLGKKCLIEYLYFTLKGDQKNALRRKSKAVARLSANSEQLTWYYSVGELQLLFEAFSIVKTRPIGLLIPPSYLEPLAVKFPWLTRIAAFKDRWLSRLGFFSDYGDHVYIEFQKR